MNKFSATIISLLVLTACSEPHYLYTCEYGYGTYGTGGERHVYVHDGGLQLDDATGCSMCRKIYKYDEEISNKDFEQYSRMKQYLAGGKYVGIDSEDPRRQLSFIKINKSTNDITFDYWDSIERSSSEVNSRCELKKYPNKTELIRAERTASWIKYREHWEKELYESWEED